MWTDQKHGSEETAGSGRQTGDAAGSIRLTGDAAGEAVKFFTETA